MTAAAVRRRRGPPGARAMPRRLAMVAALALLGACAPPDESVGRIDGVERVEVGPGRHLETVRATAKIKVTAREATLRGALAATRAADGVQRAAECALEGSDGSRRPLATAGRARGAAGAIAIPLARGEWTLSCGGGARFDEPRLAGVDGGPGRLLVLVVVDTLRDDFVGPATMPLTVAALGTARRFTDVRANASWTLPSMASALTSRPVLELTAPDGTLIGIPANVTTLAAHLRASGFATAAFLANGTLREGNGFGQGFDRFETTGGPADPPPDASQLLAAARRWIAAHDGEDAFVWLHLMEPHEPLRDHAGRGRVAVASSILAGRERPATPEEAATFRELYRLEVAHADELLGPFLRALPAEAIVALTADHGEMLGEGSVWGHGLTLYGPVLRVPFLLRAPGVEGVPDDRPGELLDLVPTLLGRVGVASPAGALAGVDLLSRGRRDRPRLAATFSAGPLRWAYRRGELAALLHFAPREDLPDGAPGPMLEADPLPIGAWSYAPDEEPVGAAGAPLAAAALAEVARAFARDVGQMVPGYQAVFLDQPAGAELAFTVSGGGELAQVHATSPVRATREGDRLVLAWSAPQPLALVAFGPGASVRPLARGWKVGDAAPPPVEVPGLLLWRNPRAGTAQHPQAEILEHLRALGYVR